MFLYDMTNDSRGDWGRSWRVCLLQTHRAEKAGNCVVRRCIAEPMWICPKALPLIFLFYFCNILHIFYLILESGYCLSCPDCLLFFSAKPPIRDAFRANRVANEVLISPFVSLDADRRENGVLGFVDCVRIRGQNSLAVSRSMARNGDDCDNSRAIFVLWNRPSNNCRQLKRNSSLKLMDLTIAAKEKADRDSASVHFYRGAAEAILGRSATRKFRSTLFFCFAVANLLPVFCTRDFISRYERPTLVSLRSYLSWFVYRCVKSRTALREKWLHTSLCYRQALYCGVSTDVCVCQSFWANIMVVDCEQFYIQYF